MCKRRDSIDAQNRAAVALTKACTARRTYLVLQADLLREPSTIKCLPEPKVNFDTLLDQLDALTPNTKDRPHGGH